jgi:uncharacterized BrkB/YihY/UPF0761 family membrane protein
MNFRTFFSLLFIVSISICLSTTFSPELISSLLAKFDIHNIKFIGLTSLIISIFSYIGMMFSFYLAAKRKQRRLEKLKRDRENLDKIHEELNALSSKN